MYRLAFSAIALVLAGCATFDERELAYLRGRGVPPPVLTKLERGESLTPPEIITLTRRGVPESYVLRHLEDNGVTYLVNRNDVMRMRRAGVSATVIDALLVECERFARQYAEPPVEVSSGIWWADSPYIGSDHFYGHWW